jgi:plasmid segregation protein ParM
MADLLKQEILVSSILLDEGETLALNEDGSYNLANDNGYAFHKVAGWVVDASGTRKIKTASIASRAQIGRVNASVSSSSFSGLFLVDGIYYTVSESVTDPERIRNTSYAHSELNNVLIANSILNCGLSDLKVNLTTGLPLKQYFNSDGVQNKVFAEKVKNSLTPLASPVDMAKNLSIDTHDICAESLSAFIDWYINDEGDVANEISNGVLVVDIGGGTTDISTITPDLKISMDDSDTKKLGVLDLFKKLRVLISEEFNIDTDQVRDDMLDKAIRTNRLSIRGKDVDCSPAVKASKMFLAKRLSSFINEYVNEMHDHIIFVGGGAEALRDELLNSDEYANGFVIIPENPQYRNVTGMLKFMTYFA